MKNIAWPLRPRSAYHAEVSSQYKGGQQLDDPPWSGKPATGPDIIEQGSDRPPARWRPAVRWRRPPAVAIILGVAGLLVGLAGGYAAGTLHAGKATASPARSGAKASPTTDSSIVIGGASSQFRLRCSVPAGAAGALRSLDTPKPVTNVLTPTAHGRIIMIFRCR
jgi:hypothetical protein